MRGGIRDGDTPVATKPDRIARSTHDLLDIVDQLTKKGVGLRILSMGGDGAGYQARHLQADADSAGG